jgi:hypothetical protein
MKRRTVVIGWVVVVALAAGLVLWRVALLTTR